MTDNDHTPCRPLWQGWIMHSIAMRTWFAAVVSADAACVPGKGAMFLCSIPEADVQAE